MAGSPWPRGVTIPSTGRPPSTSSPDRGGVDIVSPLIGLARMAIGSSSSPSQDCFPATSYASPDAGTDVGATRSTRDMISFWPAAVGLGQRVGCLRADVIAHPSDATNAHPLIGEHVQQSGASLPSHTRPSRTRDASTAARYQDGLAEGPQLRSRLASGAWHHRRVDDAMRSEHGINAGHAAIRRVSRYGLES